MNSAEAKKFFAELAEERQKKEEILSQLTAKNLTLGDVEEKATETPSEEEVADALGFFFNKRSRYTHGDGMLHEKGFDTYGSCTCGACCVRALTLAKGKKQKLLSQVFCEQQLNWDHWEFLIRWFPSLEDLAQ